jgi:hypothetical protein
MLSSPVDTHKVSEKSARGSVVVKALCYKLQGRGFETPCGKSFFQFTYSTSNRNEYQKLQNNVSGEQSGVSV